MDGRTLLAADLHLDPARPEVIALAARYVRGARGAQALWLLGDLFEAWIGDDAFDAVAGDALAGFADALGELAAAGTAVHLMHGNRDFLLGEGFAARVGARLHRDDEVHLELGGEPAVLLHGDTLCTDDVEYQRARPLLRSAAWQAEQLARPVPERLAVARSLRRASRGRGPAGEGSAPVAIVDVSPETVRERFAATGATLMVHGHVHRPAAHAGPAAADGRVTRRLVVGDWHADGATVAVADARGVRLERFEG